MTIWWILGAVAVVFLVVWIMQQTTIDQKIKNVIYIVLVVLIILCYFGSGWMSEPLFPRR